MQFTANLNNECACRKTPGKPGPGSTLSGQLRGNIELNALNFWNGLEFQQRQLMSRCTNIVARAPDSVICSENRLQSH
jgi:hypothetical protein